MENLAENAWTAGSEGRLVSYVPVLDSHGVDRAVAAGGAPPLFIQIKAHERARPGDRLSFAIPLTQVGSYPRWQILLAEGSAAGLRECYLVPGADLLRLGEHSRLADGRPCVRVTLSPTSPTWGSFAVGVSELGSRLEGLAAPPGLALAPPLERSQEEGAFFETEVSAVLLAGGAGLALYRPAVDLGRDLLVQRSGSGDSLYLQIKGSTREDRPGLVRFQVRRRAFARDPWLWFLFCSCRGWSLGPMWLVPSAALEERAAAGDPEHLSFEAHLTGGDPRWEEFRLDPDALPGRLVSLLGAETSGAGQDLARGV